MIGTGMSKFELETVGIPAYGPEEDSLLVVKKDDKDYSFSISDLLRYAGVKKIPWQVATAVEYINNEDYGDRWKEHLKKYQDETGRNLPPLYKIKFIIEAEELSKEESEKLWKEYGERNK